MRYVVLLLLCGLAQARTFTEEAWERITPIYQGIRQHSFNRELEAGTLPQKKFDYYSTQDALYLIDFAKAMSTLADKVPQADDAERLRKMVKGLEEEKNAHSREELSTPLSPANFAYTNFLLATAGWRSREELAAAVLPCYWIYLRVAENMKVAANHPYRRWIEIYSADSYRHSVEFLISLTDRLAAAASKDSRRNMLDAFVTASRLEWYFWEDAYTLNGWRF